MNEEPAPKGTRIFWVTLLVMAVGLVVASIGSITSNLPVFIAGIAILVVSPVVLRIFHARAANNNRSGEDSSDT